MKKNFTTKSASLKLQSAINLAGALSDNPGFLKSIQEKETFAYTDDDGVDVMVKLLSCTSIYEVRVYTPPWYKRFVYRKTNAFATKGRIYLLDHFLARATIKDLSGTLLHELMHLLGYHHGSNRWSIKKQDSVPYFVGNLADHWME